MTLLTIEDSPLFAGWVDAVETRLMRGAISMKRDPNARDEWRQRGLTLKQRDAAVEELIRRGVAKTDIGSRGEVLIVRAA
jgi:hypothetical protein